MILKSFFVILNVRRESSFRSDQNIYALEIKLPDAYAIASESGVALSISKMNPATIMTQFPIIFENASRSIRSNERLIERTNSLSPSERLKIEITVIISIPRWMFPRWGARMRDAIKNSNINANLMIVAGDQ